jgi:hypothetical protein
MRFFFSSTVVVVVVVVVVAVGDGVVSAFFVSYLLRPIPI